MNRIIETTHLFSGADETYGFPEWGGLTIELACGHVVRFEAAFPVPVPLPGDDYDCSDCEATP